MNRSLNNFQMIKYSTDFVLKLKQILSSDNESSIKNLEKKNTTISNSLNKITVSNIYFSYKNEKILKNFSCEFYKNKISLIHGPSGSGKTTLLELLLGMLEVEKGKILFNDKLNISENKKSILSKISFVPQFPFLINGSLKNNLLIGNKKNKITDNQMISALNMAGLSDFVKKKNFNLNLILNSGADMLSGGQKQRIAIARNILGNPDFLFLDEPTSSLDIKSIKILKSSLLNLKKKMGIVIVSHDFKSLNSIVDYKVSMNKNDN
jgi:ABC-type bacteriocin/lantibiotic exporter with double-glycine peptidase domain